MPTNLVKSIPCGLAALLLWASPPARSQFTIADAQVEFEFEDLKEWRQTGTNSFFYLGGYTDIFFHDGFVVLSGCGHPSFSIIPPNPFCPLGTTAFIAVGDLDGDGEVDLGSFWSLASVQRAVMVEPYRTDLFKIVSAPPSGIADILRSSNGDTSEVFQIRDSTATVYYDVLSPPIDDYELTAYVAHRHYGAGPSELQRHYKDVPWGTYIFSLPALNDPLRGVPFAVTHLVTPDVYPGRAALPQGWRLRNENWYDGDMKFDPRTFFQFRWDGLDFTNTVANDQLFFSMRGHQYVSVPPPGSQFTIGLTRTERPPERIVEATVTGVSCIRFPNADAEPIELTIVDVNGTFVTTDMDLTTLLTPGATYEMEVTSGSLDGNTQQINSWGVPDPFTLETPLDISDPFDPGWDNPNQDPPTPVEDLADPPNIIPGDTFTLTIVNDGATIVTTNVNFTDEIRADSIYQMRILTGDLAGEVLHSREPVPEAVQYPIQFVGPQAPTVVTTPDLTEMELLTVSDISGGYVSGTVEAVDGTTITTNRNLENCLGRASYRFRVTSGPASGMSVFPVTMWGAPDIGDLTLPEALPDLAPGDSFQLVPEAIIVESTVQTVAGLFIQSDTVLSSIDFPPGGDYRIAILSGTLAGTTHPVRSRGFPNEFWIETVTDLSASLSPGDRFEFRVFTEPPQRLKVGDRFELSQLFPDWVQERYEDGVLAAVDAFTLFFGYGIFPTADLNVAPGLYGIARENQIVFPNYPIFTPPGDRQEFLLGTLDGQYQLGPFLFNIGDSVNARLHFSRNVANSANTFDTTQRFLNWEIEFIDTYEGFALLGNLTGEGFPFGTPASQRAPHFDFDRDGATNLMEYALMTNVASPTSSPEFRFVRDNDIGFCMASITKRPNVGPSLRYFFEYSGDLVNWTRILPGDPVFEIIENNASTLTVSNEKQVVEGAFPAPSCFLRVAVETFAIPR